MHLKQLQRDGLLKPLQSVSGIVERRHTLPILSNVLVESAEGKLSVTATDLEKDAGTLRRKDMFDGRSFNATRVELKRGGETLAFEKSKGKDGKDVWKNAAGKDMDTTKVEDMLTKLSNIRAQLFQDRVDPALKMPTLSATLKLDNNVMETVTFARSGNAVLASREGEPGSATVEVMAFNDAMSAIDAVK